MSDALLIKNLIQEIPEALIVCCKPVRITKIFWGMFKKSRVILFL